MGDGIRYQKSEYVENGSILIPENGVIYIGVPSDIEITEYDFCLITNQAYDTKIPELAILSVDISLKELYKQVTEVFRKKIILDQTILKLLQCAVNVQSMEKVAEIAADYLQNPIIISGANMIKIASAGPKTDDFIFHPVEKTGHSPKEEMS